MRKKPKKENSKTEPPIFTAIKMDKVLYRKARQRARQLHQDYSNYVRQLIVRDVLTNQMAKLRGQEVI